MNISGKLHRFAVVSLAPVALCLATAHSAQAFDTTYATSRAGDPAQIAARVLPAVITIRTPVSQHNTIRDAAGTSVAAQDNGSLLGSGFIIDPAGYALTNAHVVSNASEVLVTLADSRICSAAVVGRDQASDLAMLKLGCSGPLPALKLGDSSKLRIGDRVIAIGSPFGLSGTVSLGFVSARDRYLAGRMTAFIQVQADLNPGNSGGPLVDSEGRVVGISTAIYTYNGANSGIGFALPIDQVRRELPELRGSEQTLHGRIGADIHPIAPDLAQAMMLPSADGALVTEVAAGSPAQRAGLAQGDVLTSFDGRRIQAAQQLALMVDGAASASNASLTVNRHGRLFTLHIHIERTEQGAQWLSQTNDFSI